MPLSQANAAGRFATTHWSLILAAGDPASPDSHEALAELCTTYWYPVYVYIRRRGYDADQAQDLTQEFFARLLEKEFLRDVDRAKGRFRSFLLAACNHFLANEHDRATAQKRGGGRQLLSIDLHTAEGWYSREPSHQLMPEKLFERRWALTLLNEVLARLREELAVSGKGPLFDHLKVYLTGAKGAAPYNQVAEQLGMTEGRSKEPSTVSADATANYYGKLSPRRWPTPNRSMTKSAISLRP